MGSAYPPARDAADALVAVLRELLDDAITASAGHVQLDSPVAR